MTFKQIALKNFKSNIRRYQFYFLYNTFAIMLFFLFSTLLFSEELLSNSPGNDKFQEAIIIPMGALILFAVFFISYAHSTFINGRKREFGLLMTLGMSVSDIRKIILIENGIIAFASILGGILTGTIFSRFFFLLIMRIINITKITFTLSYKSYLFSIGIFSIVFFILVIGTMIVTSRFEIVKLLRDGRVAKRNKINSPWFAGIGIIMVISSLLFLYTNFNVHPESDGEVLLYSTIFMFMGVYITLSQFWSLVLKVLKKKTSMFYQHLLLLTNLDYQFKQVKKINFLIIIMVFVTIFYSGHLLNLVVSAENMAVEENPYDIAFIQTSNKNQLSTEQADQLIYSKDNPVTDHKTMELLNYFDQANYNERIIFIDEQQIAPLVDEDIQVEKGKYLLLIQLNHILEQEQNKLIDDFKLKNNREIKYTFQEARFEVLINRLNYFGNHLFVLNHDDYQELRNRLETIEVAKLQLFNVKDWKQSKDTVDEINNALWEYNETTSELDVRQYGRVLSEQEFLKVGSKIEKYNENKQGGGLVLYLFTFVGILFYLATLITLYLKLSSELEDERIKYKKLYKIGITEKQIGKNIASELKILFFISPMVGFFIALIFTSIFYKESEMFKEALISNLYIGGIYFLIQLIFYLSSKGKYQSQIIEGLAKKESKAL